MYNISFKKNNCKVNVFIKCNTFYCFIIDQNKNSSVLNEKIYQEL